VWLINTVSTLSLVDFILVELRQKTRRVLQFSVISGSSMHLGVWPATASWASRQSLMVVRKQLMCVCVCSGAITGCRLRTTRPVISRWPSINSSLFTVSMTSTASGLTSAIETGLQCCELLFGQSNSHIRGTSGRLRPLPKMVLVCYFKWPLFRVSGP